MNTVPLNNPSRRHSWWRVHPLLFLLLWSSQLCIALGDAFASPATSPDIQARRGEVMQGTGTEKPTLTVTEPKGGWTAMMQIEVAGTCSDPTADPLRVNINGVAYFVRSQGGQFSRKFPSSPGKNTVVVECANKGGVARVERSVEAVVPPIPLKLVLTSDTDGAYTDLHIYEPDGTHVYWASTKSSSGGLFFLNQQGDSMDQPGYGPYLYVHPAAPPGVYRVDVNYWPGGAIRHTLANLDVILNEGGRDEERRRVRKPLARPDETQTIAYVVVKPNRQPASVWIPGQDSDRSKPEEVSIYQREVEPKLKEKDGTEAGENYASVLGSQDEEAMRTSVVHLALAQAKRPSPRWEPAQRDCAGLVRFAYREAMRERTKAQRVQLGVSTKLPLPPVSTRARWMLPEFPKMWIRGVASGEYSEFADAETLVGYNFRRIGMTPERAQPGDLLVYRRDLSLESPYHIMMVAESRGARLAVYHNGAPGEDGSVRVVPVDDLRNAPDPVWLPEARNPSFLGVYSWNRFRRSLDDAA